MQMYAVQVASGRENSYLKDLKKLIEKKKLSESFGRLVFPQEESVKKINGKSRTYKKAAWATGYVYLEFVKDPVVLNTVVSAKGFMKFLSGDSLNPLPMMEEEAMKVTSGLDTNWKGTKKSSEELDEGDQVVVLEGPFADLKGKVSKKVSENKYTVLISVFGRETPVDMFVSSLSKEE